MISSLPTIPGSIGIFDSGYGGLTILESIRKRLPEYDYLYLGDNARAPYGQRSFELIYEFTLHAVEELFSRGCHLVILACNTASAKALRSIQQKSLPHLDPERRVLGVIRPTVEALQGFTKSNHVGVLATQGTVDSHSYRLETDKLYDRRMTVTEMPAPMWVPLIENDEADSPGADYFVEKYLNNLLEADSLIDTIILGCTHYPILLDKIKTFLPAGVKAIAQGEIVADSLSDYMRRHPEIDSKCTRGGTAHFLTTENPEKFDAMASNFLAYDIKSTKITLP